MRIASIETDGKRILLKKGDSDSLAVEVVTVSAEDLGGAYSKNKVEAKPFLGEKTKEKRMKLVVKRAIVSIGDGDAFGDEQMAMTPARRYYERWRFLRKLGIPTVSSMRVVDDRHVVMGDMTVGVAAFFGKEKRWTVSGEIRRETYRELDKTEKVFLSIDPEVIKREIVSLQMLAWANGIRLPSDDEYDLLVRPDGSFQVLLMDLTQMRKRRSEGAHVLIREREFLFGSLDHLIRDLRKLGGEWK